MRVCTHPRMLTSTSVCGNTGAQFKVKTLILLINSLLCLLRSYACTHTFFFLLLTSTQTYIRPDIFSSCCQVLAILSVCFPVDYHLMSLCHVRTHVLKATSTFVQPHALYIHALLISIMHIYMVWSHEFNA